MHCLRRGHILAVCIMYIEIETETDISGRRLLSDLNIGLQEKKSKKLNISDKLNKHVQRCIYI